MITIKHEMMFRQEDLNQDCGIVKPGEKVKVRFHYSDVHILSVDATCGCTVPVNNPTEGYIEVIYTAGQIPPHLVQQGKTDYWVAKTLTARYIDKNKTVDVSGQVVEASLQLLIFTAQI